MWKGRPHPDCRERAGDAHKHNRQRKGASRVQRLGISRPAAWPGISQPNSGQLGKDDVVQTSSA